ncbi:MAG: hypothetical protein IPM34_06785 [Saprospiraceae bacterium]|nr:hypothetical protein [Saprospiraceae bacterium]
MLHYKALFLSPMIPTYNLVGTGRFFKEVLGFKPQMETDKYSIFEKDERTVHLLPAGEDIGQMEFYLEVDDIDALWLEIESLIQHMKHRKPFNQEYGMREIHIEVPFTKTLLFIGQSIT